MVARSLGPGRLRLSVVKFVQKLDPKGLDASCLDRLQPTPIFLNFNGALP